MEWTAWSIFTQKVLGAFHAECIFAFKKATGYGMETTLNFFFYLSIAFLESSVMLKILQKTQAQWSNMPV